MTSLLVVSSVRWNFLWQRHHALARAAAEDGWDVDFLQPRPRTARQLLTYPLRRYAGTTVSQAAPEVPGVRVRPTRDWTRLRGGYDMALVYLPDRLTELLLDRVRPERITYDAVLDWAAVPPSWYPPTGWASAERRIAARPNASVTTDSAGMRDVLAARGIDSTVVHPAADEEFLRPGADVDHHRRLDRALYFGSVREEVDVDAMVRLARAGVGVDVVGPVQQEVLGDRLRAADVRISPALPMAELPAVVRRYKVVLLPYRGDRASTLLPAKYWNCLASGAWVAESGLDVSGVRTPQVVGLAEMLDRNRAAQLFSTAPPPWTGSATWSGRWADIVAASTAAASVSA